MFLLVTVITLWALFTVGSPILAQPLPAHTLATFAIFWPFTTPGMLAWFFCLLWLLWAIALLTLGINILLIQRWPTAQSSRYPQKALIALGAVGNMRRFDTILMLAFLLVMILGWATGAASLLLMGGIAALGLFLNRTEQALLS
jgi:hypothetical protein